jgi:sensor histidine kinase YesM
MKNPFNISWKKNAGIEWLFFIIYFLLFPILTDIEYYLNEPMSTGAFSTKLLYRIVYGIMYMIPAVIYYKVLLQRYLLKGRYTKFLLGLVVFFLLLNFYIVYIIYWPLSKLTFLPDTILKIANTGLYANTMMHFSITYTLRELLVVTALGLFLKSNQQQLQLQLLKQQQLETELKYLKTQVQPHFFFNTLNNIYSLALQQSENTAPLIAGLSGMMRYILYDADRQQVPLHEEIAFIKHYIALESVRYPPSIVVRLDTQGINNTICIEPLLLLPFVENAFKHGIHQETNSGYVDIVICCIDNELILQSRNSVAARALSATASGIGLDNVKKRLAMLYPGKHSMKVNASETMYEVILTISLQ